MDFEFVTQIFNHLTTYLVNLDWAYIITLIIICYSINSKAVTGKIRKATGLKSKTRYRVAITGILYAVLIYFFRGYELAQTEVLLQSFVFAFVFHKLLLDKLIKWILPKINGDGDGNDTGQPPQMFAIKGGADQPSNHTDNPN